MAADKFVLTSELNLKLSAQANSEIKKLKKDIENISLKKKLVLTPDFTQIRSKIKSAKFELPVEIKFKPNVAAKLRKDLSAMNLVAGIDLKVNQKSISKLKSDLLQLNGFKIYATVIPWLTQLKRDLKNFTGSVKIDALLNKSSLNAQIKSAQNGSGNNSGGGSGGGGRNSGGSPLGSPSNFGPFLNSLKTVKKATKETYTEIEAFGQQTALTIRRFGAFNVASTVFFRLVGSIQSGIQEAINFQKEIVKISQVTGSSLKTLQDLEKEVTRLSTSFGVSSIKLLDVAQTLAQAGLSANDTKKALEAIAKTDLSPTFTNMAETTEAAIAAMAQFKIPVTQLESTLSSLNTVAAKFAVESSDLGIAIRRAGASFNSAGGDINEFIALFTSVRATTRESAESIGTGLRTIFTRLQRAKTQDFLKDLGINLRLTREEADKFGKNANDFVGGYEAVKRLSEGLAKLSRQDPRYAQITEELGGFRQISKVLPLIQEFSTAQQAYLAATANQNSLTEDAITAQQSLANKLAKTREEFQKTIRILVESESFQTLTDVALGFANSILQITQNLKEVIPLLGSLAILAAGRPLGEFFSSKGFFKKGNRIAYASGGLVPGTGNKDNVNAVLTPGEFVVSKDAVNKLGENRLRTINQGKLPAFANGGLFGKGAEGFSDFDKVFANIPEQLRNIVRNLGVSVKITSDFATELPHLVNKNFGAGNTLNNLSGIFSGKEKKILLNTKRSADTDAHEFGHAFDYASGLSGSQDFKTSITQDLAALGINAGKTVSSQIVANLPKRLQYILSDTISGKYEKTKTGSQVSKRDRAEVLADVFSGIQNNNSQIQKLFPNVSSYVQGQINAAVSPMGPAPQLVGPIRPDTADWERTRNTTYTGQPDRVSRFSGIVGKAKTGASNLFSKVSSGESGLEKNLFKGFALAQVAQVAGTFGNLSDSAKKVINSFGTLATILYTSKGLLSSITTGKNRERLEVLKGEISPLTENNKKLIENEQISSAEKKKFRNEYRTARNAYQTELNTYNQRQIFGQNSIKDSERLDSLKNNYINAGQNFKTSISNTKTLRTELNSNSKLLTAKTEELNKLEKGIVAQEKFNFALAAGVAGLYVLSNVLDNYANKSLENYKSGGALGNFVGQKTSAGALSGAATGAGLVGGIGAYLGSIIPGLGTLVGGGVGAAIGGVGGGIFGAISGNQQAKKDVARADFAKFVEKDATLFKSIQEGSADPKANIANVIGSISGLNNKLKTTSDVDLRKDIQGQLQANAVGLQVFVQKIAGTVKSFDELENVVSKDLIVTLAELSGKSLTDLKLSISDTIRKNQEALKLDEKIIESAKSYEFQIRALTLFESAFLNASNAVVRFTSDLESSLSLSSGRTEIKDTIGPLASQLQNVGNLGQFSGRVSSFTGQFGDAGGEIGKTINSAAVALKELPNILLEIRSTKPFDLEENTLEDTFKNAFDNLNISLPIQGALLSKVSELIGKDLKDSEFFDKLSKNFGDVVKEFGTVAEEFVNILNNANQAANEELNKYVSGLEQLSSSRNTLRDLRDSRSQIEDVALSGENARRQSLGQSSIFSFTNERVRRNQNGFGDVNTLRNRITSGQNNIQSLEGQAQNTFDIGARKELLIAIQKERDAIEDSTNSLKFMADAASRTAAIQEDLNRVRGNRQSKLSYLTQYAGASSEERIQMNRTRDLARQATATGTLNAVPETFRKDVISLFEQFSPETQKELLGGTLTDVIKSQFGDIPGVTSANQEEQTIQKAFEDSIVKAREANAALQSIVQNSQVQFFNQLNSNFGTFLNSLNQTINSGFTDSVNKRITGNDANIAQLERSKKIKEDVSNNFGIDAEVIGRQLDPIRNLVQEREKLINKRDEISSALNLTSPSFNKIQDKIYRGTDGNKEVRRNINNFLSQIENDDIRESLRQNIEKNFLPNNDLKPEFIAGGVRQQTIKKTLGEFEKFIDTQLQSTDFTLSGLDSSRANIEATVGGDKNFELIRENINALNGLKETLQNQTNETVEIEKLKQANALLQKQLSSYNPSRAGFATGGPVPGTGNTDSVPAQLMPGEYVLRKSVAQSIGVGRLNAINNGRAKFATGGSVGSTMNIDVNKLVSFANTFNNSIERLGQYISSIPSQITMSATHRIEVIINGAQVLQNLEPSLKQLVQLETNNAINKMLNQKFPEAGRFNG